MPLLPLSPPPSPFTPASAANEPKPPPPTPTSSNRKTRNRKRRRAKRRETQESPSPNQDQGAPIKPGLAKYWRQRYFLFSLFDAGVQMDDEGWFSVTPEPVAAVQAGRTADATVIDCFSGVGGNAIQFAARNCHVVAIDIDPQKVAFAVNNANIYGVEDNIDFVIGDFFRLAGSLKGDIMFLSPPWGGPSYNKFQNYKLDMLKPKDGYSIFQIAQKVTPNIIMFLPRNVDLNQVEELSWLSSPPLNLEIEENYVNRNAKGITAYFGDTASR